MCSQSVYKHIPIINHNLYTNKKEHIHFLLCLLKLSHALNMASNKNGKLSKCNYRCSAISRCVSNNTSQP